MGRRYSSKRDFIEGTMTRFWSCADRRSPDECWLWTGNIALPNKCGQRYGKFCFYDGKTINYRAHRFAWMIANGRIPDGYVVMHSCDVPHCVNPGHLKAATQAENLADRDRKGRAALGSRQGHSKLTEEQALYAKFSKRSTVELGRMFHVHPTCISAIRSGKNWAHLSTSVHDGERTDG